MPVGGVRRHVEEATRICLVRHGETGRRQPGRFLGVHHFLQGDHVVILEDPAKALALGGAVFRLALAQMQAACAIARADEYIDRFPDGYDTVLEQNAANLSGGQRQRLLIARAILKKPRILILDDSTSAVDMATDEHIRRCLRTALPGATKVIIAQRINSIMSCDRIVVLDQGRLADMGTHQELLSRSHIYRDVYESQMREGAVDHAAS